MDDLVEALDALGMLIDFSALVETERKRSPLKWASCAEAVARAATKIRAEVLMLISRKWLVEDDDDVDEKLELWCE